MPTGIYKHKKGYKLSQEHKRNLSLANKGKHNFRHSEETKRKIRENNPKFWLGKKQSKETIEKNRQTHLGQIPWNKGKKSVQISVFKGKKRPNRSGQNHPNWKNGITSLNNKIRTSLEYKLWRKSVFERDNYQCLWGGKEHGNNLQADHIKPFSLFPDLRFAIDNGRTLCKSCHLLTDTYAKRQ